MKKLLLPLIFLCFFGFVGFSQTCGVATDNLPGCLMCNNVYIGNTDGYTQDINPWLPCDWENSQWLRFVAGTNPLTVSLTCFNFTNPPGPPPAGGLELALLDQNLNIVSTACGSTNMVSFTLTTAIIGETYTICIAGHNGSNFDFVLTVDDIIGGFDPQPQSIQADPDLPEYCPGQLVNYNINPVNGATGYTWVVNGSGTIVNGQNSTGIVVRMTGPGGGVVCVTPTSDCGPGTPWCKSFNVAAIPINTLPPMEFCSSDFPVRINGETFPSAGVFTKNYTGSNGCDSTVIYTIMQIIIPTTVEPAQTFCQEDFPITINGNTFNSPGFHSRTFSSYQGCDSTVNYLFNTYPSLINAIDTTICFQDCFSINGTDYCQGGNYNISLPGQSSFGCDSIINLNLRVNHPIATIENPPLLDCNSNGTITLSANGSSSGQGVSYNWTTSNGNIIGSTNTPTIAVNSSGTYFLEVQKSMGSTMCFAHDTVQVTSNTAGPDQPVFDTPGNDICSGNAQSYILDANPNATSYSWSVNPTSPFTTSGDTIEVNWTQSGPAEICVVASNACGDSDTTCLNVNVLVSPDAEFAVIDTLCQTDSALVIFTGSVDTSATVNWTLNNASGTPADTFYLNWPTGGLKSLALNITQNGCADAYAQNIWVQAPLATPMLNCTPGLNEITFSWDTIPGADGYTVFVDSVSQGSTQDLNFTISGLGGMDTIHFEVFANDTSICLPTSSALTCVARECPPVAIDISPVNTICRDASTTPVQLNYSLSGNGNNGTVSWSGNGIDNSGLFDPSLVNQGTTNLTLTYEEDGCTFMESIPVEVFDIPDADFTIDQVICVSDAANINYQGSASLNANFIWDFDNGNVISGTGSGSYQIDWNSPGSYQVDLFVEENGCNSQLVSKNIQIDAPLATPVLNCETSVSDILFTWDNIPNALDYQVNVLNGMAGTQSGNEYSISGLMVNETVTIELIVSGNTVCGPSKDTLTCQTQDCPEVQVEIEPVSAICFDGNQNSIQLSATLSGNMHQGSFSWSGPGVDASGNFNPNDPALVPGGNNRLRVTYEEMGCSYNAVYDVDILEKPIAAYTTINPICISDVSTFTYSGSNIPGLTYAWSFENGTPATAAGQGPHQVSWNATGMANIELQVINQSCPSDTLKEMIMVDPELDNPSVICDVTESEIDFNWMPVPNVNDYQVNVLQGITGNFNGFNHYIVGGLNPGDSITIEIISSGNTACGPVADTIKCYTDNCPPPTAEFGFDIDKTTVTFDNLSLNGLTYFWDLGDGNTSTDENPVHMYPRNGQYPVTLISYNDCDTVETILIVEINGPIPKAEFSSDKRRFCAPQVVEFTDNSTEDPIEWEWTFPGGDPMTSSLQNPIVTYNTPGTYPVTLKVTNIYGENNIVQTNYIIAEENPEADFEFTAQGLLVAFANRSTGAFTYTWDFGDGNASFDENPNHTYANSGTYTVSLTIGNSCGTVTKTEEITVRTSSAFEVQRIFGVTISPNPTDGPVNVSIEGEPSEEINLELFDVLGHRTHYFKESFLKGKLQKKIIFDNVPSGAYFLKISNLNGHEIYKLIIS